MFLKIIFIYFLLLCKLLNSRFCLFKFATRLIFHWKVIIVLSLLYLCSLLLLYGDIESNPDPRNSRNQLSSFCHWNLNSWPAHNFAKLVLLKAYNAIYKCGFICLSKTNLDYSIPSDHVSLDLEGYKMFRADYPNNVNRDGVCIYYNKSLPVRQIILRYL